MERARLLLVYFEEILAGALMVAMSLATIAGVIARYCFNNPLPWTEEFARYTFIWLIFMGAVVCTKQKGHIVVDSLIVLMPQRLKTLVALVADGLVLALLLVIIYYGWLVTASATQPTSTLKVPQSAVYVALPFSGGLIFLHTLREFWRKVRSFSHEGGRPWR
jgi:TRAP-type transport system small permease protein